METVSDVLEFLEELLEGFDKSPPMDVFQEGYIAAVENIYELVNQVP